MSFAKDVAAGVRAFNQTYANFKPNPYEKWIDWQIRNSPDYKAGRASNEARKRAIESGVDPSTLPAEVRLPSTSEDPGLFARIFGIGTNTASGGTPPFNPAGQAGVGTGMPAFQSGGMVPQGYVDDPSLSPEERRRRYEMAMFPPRAPAPAAIETGEELTAVRPAPPGSRAVDQPAPPQAPPAPSQPSPVLDKIRRNLGEIGDALAFIDRGGVRQAIQRGVGTAPPPDAMPEMAPGTPPAASPAGGSPRVTGAPMDQPQPLPPYKPYPGRAAVTAPPTALQMQGVPQPPPAGGTSTPGGAGGGPPAAPPPGAQRLPLADQRRTQAFDPTLDANDPGNVNIVDRTGAVNVAMGPPDASEAQKTWQRAVDGGINFAKYLSRNGEDHPHAKRDILALNSGVGAMPAEQAKQVAQQFSAGGKLTPGQSLIRYMVYKYEELNARGQTAAANQAAFEVLQRLNLEAAKNADGAVNELRTGNIIGARDAVLRAHDFSPDGKRLAMSRDGSHMMVIDEFSNQPIGQQIPMSQANLLAAAMAMRDGRALWQHLFQRASMGTKTDKDAEGRAIRNENNRMRGELLRRKLAGGGGGGRGPAVSTSRFDELTTGAKPPAERTVVVAQGDGIGPDDEE